MGEIIVGIDIGTSKVCTIIGQVNKEGQVEILGNGVDSCNGVKKGIIVDIESTAASIRNSIVQAEEMAGMKVGSAYINIMGAHVTVIDSRGSIAIAGENREITRKDMERSLFAARNVAIPEDRQIIDIIPRQFIIDGYDEIVDPVGMVGVKLEVDADIVAGKITSVQNIVKSAERAGIKIDGLVVEALSTGEIALTPDEKDMGVVLIDVGAGVTDVSVFKKKKLVFYDSIPVGGDHITNDISIGLKISYSEADKLKNEYNLALTSLINNDHEIQVIDVNENKRKNLKISEAVEIIEARVFEIFSLCKDRLDKSEAAVSLKAGVVLTGGGISYFDGVRQIADEVFGTNVRIASYRTMSLSRLEHSTAAGIIKYIAGRSTGSDMGSDIKSLKPRSSGTEEKSFLANIVNFFKSLF